MNFNISLFSITIHITIRILVKMISANHLLDFLMVGRGGGLMAPSGKFHLNGIWEIRKAELVMSTAENNNAFQWQLN